MFQPVAIQSQDPPSLWALDVGVHKLSELQWMWGHWVTLGLVTHDMGNLENLGECLGKGCSVSLGVFLLLGLGHLGPSLHVDRR